MGLAGPLWAATGNVSNLNLDATKGIVVTDSFPSSQAFTTGSNSSGYVLQSVTLKLALQRTGDNNSPNVALYSVSGGSPNASLATLTTTEVSGRALQDYVFSCSSGCQLTKDTSYSIVFTPSRGVHWGQDTSGSQTNTPSDAGWTIADDAKYKSGSSWLGEGAVKLMKVSWETPTAPGKVDGLTAAAGNNASIDLSWTAVTGATGYKVQYKSGSQDWSSTRQVSATINSRNLDNNLLTANTAYTFRVAATNAVGDGTWSDEVVATPVEATLRASGVGANSATLTIANHTGTWYYKQITPTNGTCSSAVSTSSATVSLSSGQNHTFSAYNDNQCTGTVLATTPPFLAKPGKAAGVTANAANAALDVSWTATTGASSYKIQWKSSSDTGWDATNRQTTSTNASATISSLTNATAYTVRVAAVNATGDGAWSDTATGTPSGVYFQLIADTLNAGGAQFVLKKSDGSNYTGTWYSKVIPPANATCETNSIFFKQLTGKSSATSYTITAYSDSSCATKLASLDFTTLPAKVAGVTATARNAALEVGWTAETGTAPVSYKVQWKSGPQNWDGTNRQVVTTKNRTTLTGLTNNTQYTIRVAATTTGGDGAWSDNATGTPSATALTLTVTPAANGAFFALSNHTGNFYYKVTPPSNANCDDGSTLTGNPRTFVDYTKSSGTQHNITVYSDATCSTVLTSLDFITLPGKTTGVTLKNTGASLGVTWTAVTGAASYKVQWKSSADTGWDATNRQTTSTTTSATIPSLTNNTAYTVRVAAGNASGDGAWSDTVTETPSVTLTASNVTSTGATLTVAGHTGTVYLSARGGGSYSLSCTAVSGGTHSPTLQGNTTYEFKAYSNSSCTGTALATTTFTAPGGYKLFADNITDTSVEFWLVGFATMPPGGISYEVRWDRETTATGRRCVQLNRLSGGGFGYENLEPATKYTAEVFRGAGCAALNRFASTTFTTLAADSTSPTLSASNVTNTGATLTLSGYTGSWWYSDDFANPKTCVAVTGGATQAHVVGLTANKAQHFTAWSESACGTRNTSVWKSSASFTTTGPLSVSVGDKTSTGLTVNLRGYTEANGYPDQWSVNMNGSSCKTLPRATTSASFRGLTASTQYTIRVFEGAHCPGIGKMVNETPVTTVSMAVGSVGPSSATLTLGSHEGAWSYQGGEASGQGAGAFGASGTGQCQSVPAGTYTAELDNLNSDTDYAYTAHFGGNCAGGPLAGTSFTTPPLAPPAAPSGLATATGDASATLTWSDPSDASITGYEYQVNHNATESGKLTGWGDWTAIDDSGSDTTSHVVNGLTNGREYRFRLRGQNEAGAGATAPVADPWYVSATPQAAAEPGEVPGPPASVSVTRSDGALNVSWPTVAGATSYHVTYTSDNGTSWSLAAENHPENSITIRGVENGLTYIVGVRAKNPAGSSGWTNSAPAATLASPEAVASVTAVHQGSSLAVSWPAAARADSYHVTYTSDNGTSWQLGALEHVGTSLTINGVDSTKTYLVGVRAKNAAGASGWVNSAPAAPPSLSVANATAAEPGAGGTTTLDFVVSLNRAASGTVSVDYATSDGTATAGADYTAASGTLSFAAGETSKTVSVPVLNDSHDEGSETLTLSNATGAVIDDGEATGTITNAGSMPQAWISRFGRTVAHQVVDAVATRLRSEPTPGLEVTLAGERLGWSTDADAGQPVAEQAVEQLAQWLVVGNGESGDVALRTIQGRELVANSSFAFTSRTPGEGLFSFWGRGAVTNFDGREGELTLDGEVTTWLLGTDWSWGQWPGGGEARRSTAGLLLSRSRADGGYDSPAGASSGEVAATLTGVFPWGSHRFTDRLEVWGTVGYGQGALDVTPKLPDRDKDGVTLTTDLNLWLAAAGLRGTLLDGGNDGLTITGTTDAMVVGNSSERVTGLEAAQATVTRLRLGVEAQRPITLGNPDSGSKEGSRAVLTPSLELGLRLDGGDAETGFGLDLGGGIVLSHPQRGLQAELRGRGLLSHAAEGFRDRGFSGSLSWQQQPDSDLGAALSLSQTMGGSSSGGADALLSRVTLEGLAANDGDDDLKNQRLDLQLSYGFPAFGDRFTLTPELGLGLYDSGRDYRIGWRLTRLAETGAFDLSFDVTRRESVNNDSTAPDHGVQLEWNTRF